MRRHGSIFIRCLAARFYFRGELTCRRIANMKQAKASAPPSRLGWLWEPETRAEAAIEKHTAWRGVSGESKEGIVIHPV
jgi:hypothetical protein